MKKTLIIFFILLCTTTVFSQRRYKPSGTLNYEKVDAKWLHFGFTLGLNYMDLAVYNRADRATRADQVVFKPGFSVGIISSLRLSDNWDFRFTPGLEFGTREINYTKLPETDNYQETTVFADAVLVNFPIYFKYRSKRLNNYRPYLIGGFSYKIDMTSQKRLDPENNKFLLFKKNDFYLEFGAGIDFYLPYFKLSTELKLAIGLNDILNHQYDPKTPGYEEYTDAIRKINSKIITLCIHFE